MAGNLEAGRVVLDTFEQIREISLLALDPGREVEGRERLIRFLDAYDGLSNRPTVDTLCARFGLYPYMGPSVDELGSWEAFAVELHTPPELAEEGFTFHSEQQRVYQRLMDGESVILSAPTSFGKSALVDALVASEQWSTFVLIVPTIALVDETRRRLAKFRNEYRIVTHPTEEFASKNIIVMTQERFLEVDSLPEVDFFMIDEFYKLGSGAQEDPRRSLLNLAWRRLSATGAQYYLIGPNVDRLDERLPARLRDNLVRTDFRPVAVDVVDRSSIEDQESDLVELVSRDLRGSTLVFTGTPKKAVTLSRLLESAVNVSPDGTGVNVADWIADNYYADWDVPHALRAGVATHTGPLPRSLQRIMIRLFNDGLVPAMVCTSTLIEGVNTSARNVVIFEKKIDGQLIDFFTFNNIRGRAGRMFRNFVGQVVTYMPVPHIEETVVDIPVESQSELAADADLVHIDELDLTAESRERVGPVLAQDILSLRAIRANRGYDPELQLLAARQMAEMSMADAEAISWSGNPRVEQAKATLEFAFKFLLSGRQRRLMSFSALWGKLQNARINAGDMRAQVEQQARYAFKNQSTSDIVDDVLKFQRNWMGFTIPSMLRAMQVIHAEVLADRRGLSRANYEYLIREIEGLYLPSGVAQLEDYGIPIPLGLRLRELGLRGSDVHQLLEGLVDFAGDARLVSQLSSVEQWILEDAVVGIAGPHSGLFSH
ncbi:DEAD/DEAH box helicase [Isoptericola haloaureus]|uniref:DEAD/DEAH box helicase n=1 Tax=Isoptericola haloaureus TaxID=1542902 RepID=A0ABU7Z783_9MICO